MKAKRFTRQLLVPHLLAGLCLLLASCDRDQQARTKWLADFDKYGSQKEIPSSYESTSNSTLQLQDILQTLPAPENWPGLTQQLRERKKLIPATENQKKISYQLGIILMLQLQNQPDALKREFDLFKKEITDAPDVAAQSYAIQNLESELFKNTESDDARQLKEFEEQLKALSPVSEADVNAALNDKEAATRIKSFNTKMERFYQDIQKKYHLDPNSRPTPEQAAQLQKLQAAFMKENEAEIKWFQNAFTNPIVQRYYTQSAVTVNREETPTICVPDLVKLMGRDKARAAIQNLFQQRVDIRFNDDKSETLHLAREIALQQIDQLQVPLWGLVQERGTAALFDALVKKFKAPAIKNNLHDSYQNALRYRLLDLIDAGRVPEALALFKQLPADDTLYLNFDDSDKILRNGTSQHVLIFLRVALAAHPDLNEWYLFDTLSRYNGKKGEMQSLLQATLAKPGLKTKIRIKLMERLNDDLVSHNEIDTAFAQFRSLIRPRPTSNEEATSRISLAQKWLDRAQLLQKKDWYDLALTEINADIDYLRTNHADTYAYYYSSLTSLLNILFDDGRYQEVADRAQAALNQLPAPKAPKPVKRRHDYEPDPLDNIRYELRQLLSVYFAALVELGRNTEALQLLETTPYWNEPDLSNLIGINHCSNNATERPIGCYVARALLATGQREKAIRILEAQIIAMPSNDGAYELYVNALGQKALPLLDRLYATDQFEERPLIWKAVVQANIGDWQAAEKTDKAAIAVDPTDGEEPAGDRLRAYALMGRIQDGLHNAPQAHFYHGIVEAVQMAEKADQLRRAGLNDVATDLYRESLTLFQDAYCIQFRLAKQYAAQGKMDLATEHYRKAYELMPGSFGRVESFCFGCEKAFETPLQQTLAETIFTQQLRTNPKNAQAHYMLAYLRQEQERKEEALAEFKKAVELDPLYLNAWKEIHSLLSDKKDSSEYQQVSITLTRLDPAGRHTSADLERLTNLAELWRVMHSIEKATAGLAIPKELYPLTASKQALEAKRKTDRYFSHFSSSDERSSLGSTLLRNEAIRAIDQAFHGLHPARHSLESGF